MIHRDPASLGGVLPGALAGGSLAVLGTVIKLIPIVGTAVGMAVSSGFAYALTQAVGKVFVLHYETGGSLLNFEPEKVRRPSATIRSLWPIVSHDGA